MRGTQAAQNRNKLSKGDSGEGAGYLIDTYTLELNIKYEGHHDKKITDKCALAVTHHV